MKMEWFMKKSAKHLVMQTCFRSRVVEDKRKKKKAQRLSQNALKNFRREAEQIALLG
jgi:hypothetical protein